MKFITQLPVVFCLLFACTASYAQETATAEKPESTETQVEKKRSKPRGRLPVYYNKVVSEDQRLMIYEIQRGYLARIEKLMAEIVAIKKEMNQEVETVLKPDQLKRVQELTAEGEAKRKERAAKRKAMAAAK